MALAAGVVLLVLFTAAVGYYIVNLTPPPPITSSTETPAGGYSTALLFPFNMSVNAPPEVLLAPGRFTEAVIIKISPSPSASSVKSAELIPLNATAVDGIAATFSPTPSVVLGGNNPDYVNVVLQASPSTPLGNYTFQVQAGSGSAAQIGSFNVRVVQYLVLEIEGAFQPVDLSVPQGGTVYWMDLDSVTGTNCAVCQSCIEYGPHNVTFLSLKGANSPQMVDDSVYNFTFTNNGIFFYYSSLNKAYSMNGTITVTG